MSEPRPPVRPDEEPPIEDDEDGEAGEGLALDDEVALPELDGAAQDLEADDGDGLEVSETEESVGLDDAAAEDAAEAIIELIADVEAEGWETAEDEPVGDDEELADGQEHGWTEDSEEDESEPHDVDGLEEPGGAVDEGEEGIDDDGTPRGEPELPPLRRDADVDEEYPDESEI